MRAMVLRPRLTPEVSLVRRAVRQQISDLRGSTLLLAVSGGADSLALAAAASFEAKKLEIRLAAVILDHGLQPKSAEVAKKAAQTLNSLGISEVIIEKVKVTKSGDGLEAEARKSRYKGIEKVRKKLGAAFVLLGHNLDDQAETVLLGLARGSGLKSISAMTKVDSQRKLIRPILDVPRSALRKACSDQGISFWDDPHNQDERFARVRVRKLADQLERELGPGFASALARTAELAKEADDAISDSAKKLIAKALLSISGKRSTYDIKPLAKAQLGVRRKALHEMLSESGARAVSRAQVLQVEELITSWHGQKKSTLSGITVERAANQLVVTSTKKTQELRAAKSP
jgi:tRNA(Ile)-lysidine synthase